MALGTAIRDRALASAVVLLAAAAPAMAHPNEPESPPTELEAEADAASPPEAEIEEPPVWVDPDDLVPRDQSPRLLGAVDDLRVLELSAALRSLPPSLRLSALRRATRSDLYLCDQVAALLSVFDDTYARMLRAAAILVPRIADRNNLRRVVALFPLREDKEAVRGFREGAIR